MMRLIKAVVLFIVLSFPVCVSPLTVRQQKLKAEVIELARNYTNNFDHCVVVRADLDVLIKKLMSTLLPVNEVTWTKYSIGLMNAKSDLTFS